MKQTNALVIGLPAAGKTTFLAALWHLLQSREIETALRYNGLEGIDVSYLNELKKRWLQAEEVGRTKGASASEAVINLRSNDGEQMRLTIPDFAGEGFRRPWTHRLVPSSIVSAAQAATGHLLIVNVDTIQLPRTAEDLADAMPPGMPAGPVAELDFKKSPTAAILCDLLYSLEAIGAMPSKVAVALSAWDTAEDQGLTPEAMLRDRLPMLAQFMEARSGERDYRVFGISAQGGSYEHGGSDKVREEEIASHRIRLVEELDTSHDLTRMLAWLLE